MVMSGDIISSTELLVENSPAWQPSGDLPSPRCLLRGANIDQRVIMTGNKELLIVIRELSGKFYIAGGRGSGREDEILEYSPRTGEWCVIDKMLRKRSFHAVSIVSTKYIKQICT